MADSGVDLGPHAGGSSQPIALQTRRLSYHVSVTDKSKPRRCLGVLSRPTKQRQILDEVNILARPGELTAIMGPSGSGKTTLLELISSRVHGNTTGEILINGAPVTRRVMTKIAGYVKQKDILLPSATVRESIEFSAKLRLPAKIKAEERDERVDSIISKLGLTKCADTKLGDDTKRGVSGGELKRTAIGVEMVTQPNLLFLDEPTSGLDSSSAYTIVNMLQRISRDDGTTVICTLHQPRSNIFYLFDRLILLHAGRIIYQGTPENAITFFQECGHSCPPYTNPPDFFMDVITDTEVPGIENGHKETAPLLEGAELEEIRSSTPNPSSSASKSPKSPSNGNEKKSKRRKRSKEGANGDDNGEKGEGKEVSEDQDPQASERVPDTVDQMAERWKESKQSKRVVKLRDALPKIDVKKRESRKPGCFSQTLTLFERSWANNLRHPLILWAQLFQHVLLALFIGLMYLRIGKKEDSTTDRAAAIFFSLLNVSWVPALTAAFVFPSERPLFNRERAGGFYKTLPYYLATTLSDQPLQILFVIINSAITYWMLALNPSFARFVIFTVLVLLCLIATQSIALLVSSVSPTVDVANLIAGLVLLLFMAFGGFLLSAKNVPPYFYPIQYTSPYRYSFRALAQNDLKGETFKCNPVFVPCPSGNFTIITDTGPPGNATGPLAPNSICSYPCSISNGEQALKALGLDESSVLKDSMILLGMIVIVRFLIYLSLEFIHVGGS